MKAWLTMLCILLLGCSPELPDKKALVQELLDQKIADLYAQKAKDCRATAIADAKAHVDTIFYLTNGNLSDTIDFPVKPIKPSTPDHIIGTVGRFEVEK